MAPAPRAVGMPIPSSGYKVTTDRLDGGEMTSGACLRHVLPVEFSITGGGTVTRTPFSPATGTRIVLYDIALSVTNSGGSLMGGNVSFRMTLAGQQAFGQTDQSGGAYTAILPLIRVDGGIQRFYATGLLGKAHVVSSPYDGANDLLQVVSTLGTGDDLRLYAYVAPLARDAGC